MDVIDIEQQSLPEQIESAAIAGDADELLRLFRQREERSIFDWSRQCKALRSRIEEMRDDSRQAQSEVRHLEPILRDATERYARAIEAAEQARIEMQTIQLKLGGLDSRIEVLRQDINDRSKELRTLVNSRLNREG